MKGGARIGAGRPEMAESERRKIVLLVCNSVINIIDIVQSRKSEKAEAKNENK